MWEDLPPGHPELIQLGVQGIPIPPELWGERWEVLQQCLKTYNPALGALANYFARAWKFYRIDRIRYNHCAQRGGKVSHEKLDKRLLYPPAPPEDNPDWRGAVSSVLVEVKKDPLLYEYLGLVCRGCTEKEARLALGKRAPARSTMLRVRWQIKARMEQRARLAASAA